MTHLLAKFIYFKLMKWKLSGEFPDVDRCVVIVVPHTSWVDFILGLIVRRVINKQFNYVGKKSLFRPPFGWYFRWLGGAPVDRSKNQDTVAAIAEIFEERDVFRLALAPEGTRKKVDQWKTGYYYIAHKASVPIVLVAFDYGKKEIKISEPQYTTGDYPSDLKTYEAFFKGVVGKVPEYSYNA